MNKRFSQRRTLGIRPALFALFTLMALLAACAAPRMKPSELSQARARLDRTSSDAEVARGAPVALLQARKLVDEAEQAFIEEDEDRSVFLANLASQRVEIAEQHAGAVAAKAQSEETIRKLETVRVLAREAQTHRSLLEARDQAETAQRRADDLTERLDLARSEALIRETQAAWAEAERSRNQLDYWLQRQATGGPSAAPARSNEAFVAAERIALQEREATRLLSERMAALERSRAEAARRALELQQASAASVARVRDLQSALEISENQVRSLQSETDRSAERLRELRLASDSWANRLRLLEKENALEKARNELLTPSTNPPVAAGSN